MIKLGMSGDIFTNKYEKCKDYGYDYFEARFKQIALATDEEFEELVRRVDRVGLPILSLCVMLGADHVLVGDNATDEKVIREFLEVGFSRIQRFGTKIVVFGSGKSRTIPDDMDYEKGKEQVKYFIRYAAEIAKKYGCTILLEHLKVGDTNVMNSLTEACELAKEIHLDNVFALADSYHMLKVEEPFEHVRENIDMIRHTHIAYGLPEDTKLRAFPSQANENELRPFVEMLLECGYDGALSIEGRPIEDWDSEAREAIVCLREWTNQ